MSEIEKRLRASRADRHSYGLPDPGDTAIRELPAYVYIGAAVRYTRRAQRSMDIERDILAGLRRHATEGNNAAAIVADWMQRKLAAPPGRTTACRLNATDGDRPPRADLIHFLQDTHDDL